MKTAASSSPKTIHIITLKISSLPPILRQAPFFPSCEFRKAPRNHPKSVVKELEVSSSYPFFKALLDAELQVVNKHISPDWQLQTSLNKQLHFGSGPLNVPAILKFKDSPWERELQCRNDVYDHISYYMASLCCLQS